MRQTLGTGMMAPLTMANNFHGDYYAGPSGLAMGAMSAADSISEGLMNLRARQDMTAQQAQAQAEKDRVRMDELNQRQAVAQAINPNIQMNSSNWMSNRDMTRKMQLPDVGTQTAIYGLQEKKRQEQSEAEYKKKEAFATAWAAKNGYREDPTGEKFMEQVGFNPYEFKSVADVIARAEEKAANMDFQRGLKQDGFEQALILAQIAASNRGGGDNVGTWSMTPDGRARMNNKTGELVPLNDTYAKPTAPKDTIFGKEFGKKAAQDFFKLQGAAESAQQSLAGLAAAEAALDRGIYTGAGGGLAQAGRKALVGIGMGNPEDVAAGEELTKVQNEMALITRSPNSGMGLPGAVSDKDIEFLKSTQVGVDKTPAANRRFIEAARRVKQRQLDIAEMANEYVDTHGSLDQNFYAQVRKYSDSNSMFSGMDSPAANTQQQGAAQPASGISERAQALINRARGGK